MRWTSSGGLGSRLICVSLGVSKHVGRFGGVAYCAFTQSARAPLPFNELDRVVVLATGSDSVRAIVAALAEYPAMAL